MMRALVVKLSVLANTQQTKDVDESKDTIHTEKSNKYKKRRVQTIR